MLVTVVALATKRYVYQRNWVILNTTLALLGHLSWKECPTDHLSRVWHLLDFFYWLLLLLVDPQY